jgi:hypothetical protein
MADFYQICVGGIYLTKDGNVQAAGIGKRIKLSVDGVDKLQSVYLKNRFNDFRGNPIIQKTNVGSAGTRDRDHCRGQDAGSCRGSVGRSASIV